MILVGQIALGAFLALIAAEVANVFLGRWLIERWMTKMDERFLTPKTRSDVSEESFGGLAPAPTTTTTYTVKVPLRRGRGRGRWEWDA